VARAAFPHGKPSLTFRDALGTIFQDDDFADLYAHEGQPGWPPWRLALVTIMQFREHWADRQAAAAVRARIDWKYLLGLELTDSGFDFSVLSEFRDPLLAGNAEARLLDTLLERCRTLGLLKARGQQRTDSTQVLAAIRVLSRLALVAETLRAALNELATAAPEWLRDLASPAWFDRSKRRIEDACLPKDKAERDAYAQTVGAEGFHLLDALEGPEVPGTLRELPMVEALRRTWQRHYERSTEEGEATHALAQGPVRLQPKHDVPRAAKGIESPYDTAARYRNKGDTQWVGYMVHVSETCGSEEVHVITHTQTTAATVHEAMCTEPIQQALIAKGLPPGEHLVDAAYMAADLIVRSREAHAIALLGPPRPDMSWQSQVDGAYRLDHVAIDWDRQQVRCPQGKASVQWAERVDPAGHPYIQGGVSTHDCGACGARAFCTRAKPSRPRAMQLQPRRQYAALQAARAQYASEAGQKRYKRRAGVEGTLSQGVRAFGLRRARYRGGKKTHLQHVATAAAINVDRIVAWLDRRPRASTRTSRFAALRPKAA
jgi:transposase